MNCTYPVCFMLYVREKTKTNKQEKAGCGGTMPVTSVVPALGEQRLADLRSPKSQPFKASPDCMGHILLIN